MAELMNEHEQKLYENLMAHNSAYYGYELSKGEIKTILQAFTELKKYRAITEAQIREKAIDDFVRRLKNHPHAQYHLDNYLLEDIDQTARWLKEEGREGE